MYVSTTEPPTVTVVTIEYMLGDVGDQSFGLVTVMVWVTVAVGCPRRRPWSPPLDALGHLRSRASRIELATVAEASDGGRHSEGSPTRFTVALVALTCGVETWVPV